MPNNARTQADGTWVDGYTPPVTDWTDLERKIFHSWNGDQGGAYAPSGTYTFAGSGLQVTGPTRLARGGSIRGGANVFKLRDGTWPTLATSHNGSMRKIVQPIHSFVSPRPYLWSREHPYAGVGSVALCVRVTNKQLLEIPELYVPLRVVDGSTLVSLDVTFRVAQARKKAPIATPKIRILRIPKDPLSSAPVPLKLTTNGLGFDSPPLVVAPDAWYLGGAAQTFTYVADQNNVIDVTNYSYVVHIVEEQGVRDYTEAFDGVCYAERKVDCLEVITNNDSLNGASAQIEYGGGLSGVERFLVVDKDNILGQPEQVSALTSLNGIYLFGVGSAWPRAEDYKDQNGATPNWIVWIREGSRYGGTTWQCQYPGPTDTISFTAFSPDNRTRTIIVPARPRGNIYHSLTPTFAVADLRFQ